MAIVPEDFARLDERYVTRKECNLNMDDINKKISIESTKLAVIEAKLGLILWVLAAVGGGIIAMLVKMFFGG